MSSNAQWMAKGNGVGENSLNRTHSSAGRLTGLTSSVFFRSLPRIRGRLRAPSALLRNLPSETLRVSAAHVVAPQGEQECLSYHKYRPCG
jgi:hypothetical protein